MSDSMTLWTIAHQAPHICGILQARILEWVAIPLSRRSPWPRDWTQVSCIAGRFFSIWATRKAQFFPYLGLDYFLIHPLRLLFHWLFMFGCLSNLLVLSLFLWTLKTISGCFLPVTFRLWTMLFVEVLFWGGCFPLFVMFDSSMQTPLHALSRWLDIQWVCFPQHWLSRTFLLSVLPSPLPPEMPAVTDFWTAVPVSFILLFVFHPQSCG